jgi:hypothetical protein
VAFKRGKAIRVNWCEFVVNNGLVRKIEPPISLDKPSVSLISLSKEIKMKAPHKLNNKEIPHGGQRVFPLSEATSFCHQLLLSCACPDKAGLLAPVKSQASFVPFVSFCEHSTWNGTKRLRFQTI